MSSALMKAIGYGMGWHEFESLTTLDCEAHETFERLAEAFEALSDPDLTVPREWCDAIYYGPRPSHPSVLERRLLALAPTDGGREDTGTGRAEGLYETVDLDGDGDPSHVLFFPNLWYAKRWRRRDDDLDLAFERWRDGSDRFYEPRIPAFAKEVGYGHHPYATFVMTEGGEPREWQHFLEMRERPDLVPAVPSEIRWYLTTHGIMDEAGVNRLRPLVAQWWS